MQELREGVYYYEAEEKNTEAAYNNYLKEYPNGKYVVDIRLRLPVQYIDNLEWGGVNDFNGGYFDTFYTNNLIYAIPSISYAGLKHVFKHPLCRDREARKQYSDSRKKFKKLAKEIMSKFLVIDRNDVERKIKAGITRPEELVPHINDVFLLTGDGKKIIKVKDITISGQSGWSIPISKRKDLGRRDYPPTLASPHIQLWQMQLCTVPDVRYVGWSKNSEFGDTRYKFFTARSLQWRLDTRSRRSDHWAKFKGRRSVAVLVKEANNLDKMLYNDSLTVKQKLNETLKYLVKKELAVKRRVVEEPRFSSPPQKPILTKGEFEKSTDFNKRKEQAIKGWKKQVEKYEKEKKIVLQGYDREINAAEIEYQTKLKENSKEEAIIKAVNKVANDAINLVLGTPKFKDVKYDADEEVMIATVYSSKEKFSKTVKIKTKVGSAKETKQALLERKFL